MDDTDWAANGFFSPSKAKLAQAQARDWGTVDAWLSRKYSSARIPSFERNDDTLQALLTLISLNEAADERRLVTDRVEKAALQYYSRQQQQQKLDDDLYQDISAHLGESGHDAIDKLARASLLLHAPIRDGVDELLASAIALQMRAFESQQAEQAAMTHYKALTLEHDRLLDLLADLKHDSFMPTGSLLDQTVQWTKGVKHLRAKISEYDERLTAMRPVQSPLIELLENIKRMMLANANQRVQLENVARDIEALESFSGHTADRQIAQMRQELHTIQTGSSSLLGTHTGVQQEEETSMEVS